jgi:hypothetical protein
VTGPIHGFNAGQKIGPVQPRPLPSPACGIWVWLEDEPTGYKVQRSFPLTDKRPIPRSLHVDARRVPSLPVCSGPSRTSPSRARKCASLTAPVRAGHWQGGPGRRNGLLKPNKETVRNEEKKVVRALNPGLDSRLPHIRKDTRKEESKEKVRAAGPLDKKSPIQAVCLNRARTDLAGGVGQPASLPRCSFINPIKPPTIK